MQSGKKSKWILEYSQSSPYSTDNLMHWVGSSDTQKHIRLYFFSKEDAVAYAVSNELEYVVQDPINEIRSIQQYSDNFR